MTTTTYYNLKKPAGTDFYDVADQNGNMDIIDAALHEIASDAGEHYLKQLNSAVAVASWSESSYEAWPYKADITFTGCTADYVCDVMFSPAQVALGIFAPIAEASAGKVTIYAEEVPSAAITIPVIELRK